MKQNNHSFDSINDRNLQSPCQLSHAEFLQSRKEFIMNRITSQKYKDAKQYSSPQLNQGNNSSSDDQYNMNEEEEEEEEDQLSIQSPIKQTRNELEASQQIRQFRQVDNKKLQNIVIQHRNEANKSYSIQNFQNILREIGLIQNSETQSCRREDQPDIRQSEYLWRVIQFSCNSPFASQQIILSVLQHILNKVLPIEQISALMQNELINNFKECTQQNGEEFLKQLAHSNIDLQDIVSFYQDQLKQTELNECVLYDAQSSVHNINQFNIYKGVKEARHEKLFQHAQILNQKRNTFSLLKQKEELDQCTFQPSVNRNQINMVSPKHQKTQYQSVHNRLYENAQDIKKNQEEYQNIRDKQREEEIQSHTFHPKINKVDALELLRTEKKNISDCVPGVKSQVDRMEKARRIKTEKDEFWDKQMQSYREREVKLNTTKTQEFSFMNRNPLKREPIMYLDVNITSSKKGRIALYKGDDYKKVSRDFAKIYRLNQDALKELEERVQQAIQIYYSQFA